MPLTEQQLAALINDHAGTLRDLDRLDCSGSLSAFIKRAWTQIEPSQVYKHNWHIDAISAHLEAVSRGELRRVIFNVPPGPMHFDSQVETARGRIRLADIEVGDLVLTHRGRYRKVEHVHDQGDLPILRITTNSGRVTRAAPTHPYLTPIGWVQAGDLRVGDVLAVVNRGEDRPGAPSIAPEAARLLGYLVGDGGLTQRLPSFVNADEEVIADFERCATALGFEYGKSWYHSHWQVRLKGPNPRAFVERHGLTGASSYVKFIPKAVLDGGQEALSNFVGAYWTCDGGFDVRPTKKRGSAFRAYGTTVSERLAGDLVYALGLLGIEARLRHKERRLVTASQPGGIYRSFSVEVQNETMTAMFADMPGLCSRKRVIAGQCRKAFRQTLWGDTIVEIEPVEVARCLCLTVEEDHSFTCSGIAVKNSMKSIQASVMFPAWEWGPRNMPGLRYIGTSYSERFAIRDNARTKNLVTSTWYQERWGDHVNLVKFGEKKFENTAYGFREAIPFTSLTGGRADRLIIDDPHSTETAESDNEREKVTRIFLESVPTRLNDPEKSAIIIIMQRLHEEDVTGVALSHDLGYEHVMIPMEYDPSRHFVTRWFEDPRTKEGELMFPSRFPAKVVQEYKDTMGPYASAGQMQQAPMPRGGGIFRWDWWQLWGNPDDSEDERFKKFPAFEYVVASLDGAYTEKSENDFSALTVWGVFRDNGLIAAMNEERAGVMSGHPSLSRSQQHRMVEGPKIMLMRAWQARLPLHELVDRVAKTCRQFKVDRLLIEGKGPGISVAQEIRRLHAGGGWSVQLIDPGRSDKVARAYTVQPLFSDGMVFAPDREWADMVKSQMATFPKASHDDLCLVGETMIATDRGPRQLRDVHVGDRVLTPDGWRAVLRSGPTGIKPIIKAGPLAGTANHPIFTFDRGYVRMDTATQAQQEFARVTPCGLLRTALLKSLSSTGSLTGGWEESVSTIYRSPAQMTDGAGLRACMSRFGSFIRAGQYRQAMRFITKTATLSISSLTIWSAYQRACIGASLRGLIAKSSAIFLPPFARSPALGTAVLKDGSGIDGMSPSPSISPELPWTLIPFAAQSSVSGAGPKSQVATPRSGFVVPGASIRSLAIDAANTNSSTHTRQVFNIEVEGAHCYYANGVLVHNCDSGTQALKHLRDIGLAMHDAEVERDYNAALAYVSDNAKPLYPV